MKNYFLLILTLFISLASAQQFKIPDIKFEKELASTNQYVKQLNLKDKDALILVIGIDNDSAEKGVFNLIVFNNDGSILKFELTEKHSNKQKKVIPIALSKSNYKIYWDYLYNSTSQQKFDFDKNAFNITNGVSKLSFEIIQGKNYTGYYNLREKEFFGKNEEGLNGQQKRLLSLVREISKLFDKY